MDRTILDTLIDKFKGGPVGLNSLAVAVSEDVSTIEDVSNIYKKYVSVDKVLTVTANVCIPALPPIDATIGIKKACLLYTSPSPRDS